MSIAGVVRLKLQRSITLYEELIAELPEAALSMKLPAIPSNTIGEQIWCVVGARESYRRAIEVGSWAGFSSSLTRAGLRDKSTVQVALATSGRDALEALASIEAFDDARNHLVVDFLEHEAAHHGQLIRYLLGLRLPIPAGWKARYALD
jgi:hypothetical protein